MFYFANPCADSAVVAAQAAGLLGYIDTPAQGNVRPDGVVWCADNGAFSDRFDEGRWTRFLTGNAAAAGSCAFAVAPDVVGDHAATLERSRPWLERIRRLGYPAAFALQDGADVDGIPWPDFDVLFIGGSTGFKLGPAARECVAAAAGRGVPVHMGRVNSERRYTYARLIGCTSADGTILTYGARKNLPHVLAWLRGATDATLF